MSTKTLDELEEYNDAMALAGDLQQVTEYPSGQSFANYDKGLCYPYQCAADHTEEVQEEDAEAGLPKTIKACKPDS